MILIKIVQSIVNIYRRFHILIDIQSNRTTQPIKTRWTLRIITDRIFNYLLLCEIDEYKS